MSRSVLSLPIPASSQEWLVRNGYRTVADIDEGCTDDGKDATLLRIKSLLSTSTGPNGDNNSNVSNSAWFLVQQRRTQRHFLTRIDALDGLLGGHGLRLGSIVEVVGDPGSGQTQLCLQLCVAATAAAHQLSPEFDGGGAGTMRAVYVDCVGAFSATAAERLCQDALDKISVFRIFAAHELMALLSSFDSVCRVVGGSVGLLVVNTVSWPFLASFPDNIMHRQTLQAAAAALISQIASKHKIAVVIVSQAKAASSRQPPHNNADRSSSGTGNSSMPAAASRWPASMDGDIWSRISTHRVALRRGTGSSTQPASLGGSYDVALCGSSEYPVSQRYIPING
ncbi:DNA repair protein rad51c [Coemansia sp. RSA 2049]|nr:DNA repair protein rad51c [Coemansia sp. RSA 2049]